MKIAIQKQMPEHNGASEWQMSCSYAQGLIHKRRNIPCQDRTASSFRKGAYAICLADGAGSHSLSQHGAQAVVNEAARYFTTCFNSLMALTDDEKISHIEKLLHHVLEKTSIRVGCSPRELASTFLVVAVKGDEYIAVHVGDGVIGAVEDFKLKVISLPENAEYDNVTYFTTYSELHDHIRIKHGSVSDISGFILMSDGAADTLHVHGSEKLAPAVVKLMLYCAEHPDTIDVELQETLEEMLVQKTSDDCAVAILARRPEDLKKCLDNVSANWSVEIPAESNDRVRINANVSSGF